MLSDIDHLYEFGTRAQPIDDVLQRLDAALGEQGIASKITKVKVGPFIVEASYLKDPMQKTISLVFTAILFVNALQGPRKFVTTMWIAGAVLLAYAALRNIAGWNTADSSDMFLQPIQSFAIKAGDRCLGFLAEAVETFMFARDAYYNYRMHKDSANMEEHNGGEYGELECKQHSHVEETMPRTRAGHDRMSL